MSSQDTAIVLKAVPSRLQVGDSEDVRNSEGGFTIDNPNPKCVPGGVHSRSKFGDTPFVSMGDYRNEELLTRASHIRLPIPCEGNKVSDEEGKLVVDWR